MAKPPEAPNKDHSRSKGTEEAKVTPEISSPPPVPRVRPAPAPPLGSRLMPVVVHPRDGALSPLEFVFYQPVWPNSLSPFCTAQEPCCGFRFQQGAHRGRRRTDLQSCQPAKWRSCHRPKPQLAQARPRQ